MKNRKKLVSSVALFFALAHSAIAQCAMCKANAESNLKSHENNVGKGLNTGILYLMSIPYIMGGVAVVIYFKNRKKAD